MKAHILNQQATIDGQVFEAPGIEDGKTFTRQQVIGLLHIMKTEAIEIQYKYMKEHAYNDMSSTKFSDLLHKELRCETFIEDNLHNAISRYI